MRTDRKDTKITSLNLPRIAFLGSGEIRIPNTSALERATRMRTLSLLCAIAPAYSTIELTPDTFNKEVFESGKSAFIKFLAPW